MGWFTPYKRKANEFKYTPRYFDADKERREQRRRELCGESSADADAEYQVGRYIRTQRAARAEARAARGNRGRHQPIVLLAGIVLIVLLAYMLYSRIVSAFATTQTAEQSRTQSEEFNPYTPITVVPNDYKEE